MILIISITNFIGNNICIFIWNRPSPYKKLHSLQMEANYKDAFVVVGVITWIH